MIPKLDLSRLKRDVEYLTQTEGEQGQDESEQEESQYTDNQQMLEDEEDMNMMNDVKVQDYHEEDTFQLAHHSSIQQQDTLDLKEIDIMARKSQIMKMLSDLK